MKDVNIFGVSWKIQFLGGFLKNQYIGRGLPKGGGRGGGGLK